MPPAVHTAVKSMAILEWSDILETGLADVDSQHRCLVDTLNELGRLHYQGATDEEFRSVLERLRNYTVDHFQTEAELMQRYPVDPERKRAHLRMHQNFVDHLNKADELVGADPVVVDHLLSFVVKWLVHHVTGVDAQLAREIFALRSGVPAAEIRQENHLAGTSLIDIVSDLYECLGLRSSELLKANRQLRIEIEQRQLADMARDNLQQMETLRVYMLEQVTSAIPLKAILVNVVLKLEAIIPDSLCAILLLDQDGRHLRHAASPSLPDFYVAALDGLQIGAAVGCSGNTVFTGTRTNVEDIASHADWASLRPLAEKAGLGACWSEPIFSNGSKALGAITVYYRTPSTPGSLDIELLEMSAHFIAIAIERKQSEVSLRKLSQAVEQSNDAIIITDKQINIEYVNTAFIKKSGYSLAELIGENPRLLQSGKTPRATYDDLWAHLARGEPWQGELINKRKDGTEYVHLMNVAPLRDVDGRITHYVSNEEDITEHKRADERIHYLAHFDALTGLPNRALLEERANYAFNLTKRNQDSLALMFLDLDHFKNINDSLGHSLGDALLIELVKRLRLLVREGDTIARMGGDEFILLLPGTNVHGAEQVAQKLLEVVNQAYQIAQYDLTVTASIGIAIYPDDGADLESLSKNADAAMYRVKREGRNGYRFFTPEMQAQSVRHLQLVNGLRHALERDQLQVHYQPQISLLDGHVIGAEALLRWQHPELGAVSPAEFIPIAEESGLIFPIGEWVLRTAVQQLKTWHDRGLGPLVMSVNLSTVQFRHSDLPDLITRILDDAGLPPEHLELELTEGVAMHDPQGAITVMNNLHERGIRMSIDDFGTGYSSLSYLKKFKIYKLKIDQSFVRDISTDAEDKAIVVAIISMAQSLGLRTIAEGVETKAQLEFLREQGCAEVQGYYYSKPLPAEQLEAFLRESRGATNHEIADKIRSAVMPKSLKHDVQTVPGIISRIRQMSLRPRNIV